MLEKKNLAPKLAQEGPKGPKFEQTLLELSKKGKEWGRGKRLVTLCPWQVGEMLEIPMSKDLKQLDRIKSACFTQ